jgi:hypothetical protein
MTDANDGSTALPAIDLTELRALWQRRRAAAEPMRRRIDPRGMTRPARSPEERAWLQERGEVSMFVEVERTERE